MYSYLHVQLPFSDLVASITKFKHQIVILKCTNMARMQEAII